MLGSWEGVGMLESSVCGCRGWVGAGVTEVLEFMVE